MRMALTNLDGLRLRQPGRDEVWMIFQGLRHRVADPETYEALFADERIIEHNEVETIAQGPDLHPGSCLARPNGSSAIYLVFGRPRLARYFIPTLASFDEFGFSMAKVLDVPPILLDAIPVGPELEGAADRMSRRDLR
ncbi:hypothetical protein GOFOIKOB_6349 [Methylobacterium tardum]|uniref:Uncharacterized protein n=1 Tax=Methylobacterium tardum TaxID=374432 RepID=A0AA37TDL6_9HYPH|nr:hypothetical protein [Methylobacterium tardum]URD37943.1 hypothetical protein M6G65_05435 [Methylobacterium tardum]GJE53271.1 hypothetical protein GOFOIKOB_6349 [Methylobacterium tardum]GLS67997.1 hypothetical protein GCM10007890_00080 [Methylobacterium tardum]